MASLLAMTWGLFVKLMHCGHLYFTRVELCYQYIDISQHFLLRDTYRLLRYAFNILTSYKPTGSRTVCYKSRQRLTYIPGPARAQIAKFTVTLYFSPNVKIQKK